MEKSYHPPAIETHWYQIWENNQYFKASGMGNSYCIMLPPPNVTGNLHMGHGFQDTLMDTLIRYHRMCGANTLWQVGTDHAGIATQMVVERQLAAENKTRHAVGRDAFTQRVWEWKQESGDTITRQLRRLGVSADWSRERFTMDSQFSQAVQEVFIRLYNEGLIYRGKRLVNWDPHLLTSISDLEVISEEMQGEIWTIRYPLANNDGYIEVATTRPETLLGDVAVAVHSQDERYQHLIGQQVRLPLTDRLIPIIADDSVDPTFGTGCVKITPAHDFNDNAMGARHGLPLINIFTPTAHLNENAPAKYQGLERFAARKQIIADLTAQNLLVKIEPHTLKIPRGDRSGVVVEPYLTDQWFMQMSPLAKPAIEAVKTGAIRFVPENWRKTYFQWLTDIQDWCISRQLWWGHRIPAWYDKAGNIYVEQDETAVRKKYQLAENIVLQQDNDVLDTWFSSALWPFTTLGWPQQTLELATYYPTSVLVTGFDIIFFWVARMIMLGLKFTGKVPFKEIYMHGLIRDQEGQKMSKSKGNVLDPIDLIDGIDLESLINKRTQGLMQPAMAKRIADTTRKQFPHGIPAFGTDALRFTYCALASTGRDIRFDLGRIEGYRNFCNKLWNAARFVLMNVSEPVSVPAALAPVDRWIISRLQAATQQTHQHFKEYRFDLVAQAIYEFIWNEYCDWYLEFAKPVTESGTRYTLIYVLETALRLLHPLMPFITEEIWQKIAPLAGKTGPALMLQSYPEIDNSQLDPDADNELAWLKAIILSLRNIRGEIHLNPGQMVDLLCQKGNEKDKNYIHKYEKYISSLAKIKSLRWLADNDSPPAAAIALAGDLHLLIPLAGLIDVDAETRRIRKELDKLTKGLTTAQAKLNNENFVNNAPAVVVAQEHMRVAEWQTAISKLKGQLRKLDTTNN